MMDDDVDGAVDNDLPTMAALFLFLQSCTFPSDFSECFVVAENTPTHGRRHTPVSAL